MSKRGSEAQGGEERYGPMGGHREDDVMDTPKQATAAQMARRR